MKEQISDKNVRMDVVISVTFSIAFIVGILGRLVQSFSQKTPVEYYAKLACLSGIGAMVLTAIVVIIFNLVNLNTKISTPLAIIVMVLTGLIFGMILTES